MKVLFFIIVWSNYKLLLCFSFWHRLSMLQKKELTGITTLFISRNSYIFFNKEIVNSNPTNLNKFNTKRKKCVNSIFTNSESSKKRFHISCIQKPFLLKKIVKKDTAELPFEGFPTYNHSFFGFFNASCNQLAVFTLFNNISSLKFSSIKNTNASIKKFLVLKNRVIITGNQTQKNENHFFKFKFSLPPPLFPKKGIEIC